MNHPTTIREVLLNLTKGKGVLANTQRQGDIETALQDITRLVEEAKPEDSPHHEVEKTNGFYSGVLTYEANLRKVLE